MFYRKNVGNTERFARGVAGASMLLVGLLVLQASPLGLVLAASGVVALLTGAVGFCPACAMIGRKPLEPK